MSDLRELFVKNHADGSLWARGEICNGEPRGSWEWVRKAGTALRSGPFQRREQISEWTTYDRRRAPYKVTTIKTKVKK